MSENKVIILDAGFASQLSRYVDSQIDEHPLWCSRFNATTNPDAVIKTHLDFLKAGSDCISTNTYQGSIIGYMKYLNLKEDESIDLIKNTVKLAQKARKIFMDENQIPENQMPKIIGVIGPYGAHLHDCSEYTGNYASYVTTEEIIKWHRPNIITILDAGVDILGFMTIPCKFEAEILLKLMCNDFPNVKFLISFQCKNGDCLADGEKLFDVANFIWKKAKTMQNYNLLAVGINCVNPKYVTSLLKNINSTLNVDKIPLLVSPTSGEIFDVNKGWTCKEECIPLENYIPEWISLGMKYVGGCCRTDSNDIEHIKQAVEIYNNNKCNITQINKA